MKPRWVLASHNRGKLKELTAALAPLDIELRPLSDWTETGAEETGATFVDNALLKARHAAAVTGLPALADDSGLEVDALGGAPGVYSARYAGPDATDADNNARLLRELEGVEARAARFRCVIAFVRGADDPHPLIAEGCWEGRILHAARGDGGFGYDPLFEDPASGLSGGELSPQDKLARSHRGQALRRFIAAWQAR